MIAKLVEIVRSIDHVDKAGENKFQNYRYVRATDVAWAVRKALVDKNVYLASDVVEIRNYEIPAKEGFMQAVDVKMEFSFFDGDAPETPPVVLHSYGTGTDKGDKAVYKAITGALKSGLRNAFLIPDESDPEADESVDKATATERAQALGREKVATLQAARTNGNGVPKAVIPTDDLIPQLQASLDAQKAKKAGDINFPPIPEPEPPKPRIDASGADIDDVVGEIRSIADRTTKDKKRAYKVVTVVDIFGAVLELSAFDNFKLSDGTLFQYLVEGAVGQQATFTYATKSKDGKTYHNIINVSRIGSHRWDDGVGVLEQAAR